MIRVVGRHQNWKNDTTKNCMAYLVYTNLSENHHPEDSYTKINPSIFLGYFSKTSNQHPPTSHNQHPSTSLTNLNPFRDRNHRNTRQRGVGDQKKLIRGSKKNYSPGDQKKLIRGSKTNYSQGIETLSCGRGAKIASLTGSKKIIHVDRNAFVWKGSKNCLTDRIKKIFELEHRQEVNCSNVSESRMVKLAVTCELYAFSGLHFSNSLYRSKQGLLHLKNSEWFVPRSGVGPQLCNPDLLTTMMVVFVLNLLLLLLLLFMVVVDIVDGAGAGGFGAVRGGNL